MAAPVKLNYKIYKGSTFSEVLRWESSTKVYKYITGITNAAPVVITSVGHAIPPGWRFKVTNVVGMKELNSADIYHIASDVTSDTLSINNINAIGFTAYVSGGVLEYNFPTDLSTYSARLQIRAKIDSADILLELTTSNGGIVLDNTNKTITINISAVQSSEFTFTSAVYSLELYTVAGYVLQLASGTISVEKEVTR
jgi:hypothetical protein